MAEHDRLFHPVTGCLAGVFLLLVGPALLGAKQQEADQRSRPPQAHIEQSVDPAAPVNAERNRRTAEERDEADVRAQERMADATERAVDISFWALIGLGATVLFAYLAWREAKRSADADNEALELTKTQLSEAREAATDSAIRAERQINAAEHGASASRMAAATARTIGQDQLRAYISVSGYRVELSGVNAFSVNLVNRGQTPARGIKLYYELTMPADTNYGQEIIGPDDDFLLSTFDLGKDQDHVVSVLNDSTGVRRQRLHYPAPGGRRTHFVIYVAYCDVFGRCFEFKSDCEFVRMVEGGRYETANLTSTETTLSKEDYALYVEYKGTKK